MKKIGDFAGTKNGSLQAIQFIKRDKGGNQIWLFKCDCGCLKEIKKWNVLRKHGPTHSCGKCSFSRRGKRGEGFKNKDWANAETEEQLNYLLTQLKL